jgi:hypothetical protein
MLRVGTQVLDAKRPVFGSNAEHWSQLAKFLYNNEMIHCLVIGFEQELPK